MGPIAIADLVLAGGGRHIGVVVAGSVAAETFPEDRRPLLVDGVGGALLLPFFGVRVAGMLWCLVFSRCSWCQGEGVLWKRFYRFPISHRIKVTMQGSTRGATRLQGACLS